MINVLTKEQVDEQLAIRRINFPGTAVCRFYVLTPQNDIFIFLSDGDFGIVGLESIKEYPVTCIRVPKIASVYNLEYESKTDRFFHFVNDRARIYNLFVRDPECTFFHFLSQVRQELENRGVL